MRPLLLLLVAVLGCDCNDSPPPETREGNEGVESAESDEGESESESETEERDSDERMVEAPEAPPAPERPSSPDAVPRDMRQAAQRLREGRVLARRGDWAEAVTKFRETVELADSARARCELGWALYQTQQLDDARRELERAITPLRTRAEHREDEVNTFGACLYNLGRVVEESDPVAAREHYRASLEVRPNDTVRARLDALTATEAPAPICEPRACIGPLQGTVSEALSAGVARHYGRDSAEVEDVGDEEGEAGETFVFRGGVSGERTDDGIFLALNRDDGWHVCFLLDDVMADYTFPDTIRRRQWVAGGEPELDFDLDEAWHGREDGVGNTMGWTARYFVGWSEDGAPMLYGSVRTLEYYYDGVWVDCPEDGVCEENGEVYPEWVCCNELEAIEEVTRWNIRSAESGALRVERIGGDDDDGPRRRTVPLSSLACPRSRDDG